MNQHGMGRRSVTQYTGCPPQGEAIRDTIHRVPTTGNGEASRDQYTGCPPQGEAIRDTVHRVPTTGGGDR